MLKVAKLNDTVQVNSWKWHAFHVEQYQREIPIIEKIFLQWNLFNCYEELFKHSIHLILDHKISLPPTCRFFYCGDQNYFEVKFLNTIQNEIFHLLEKKAIDRKHRIN